MSLRCGIVGLPNVGKSSLFNALSNAGAESANFPFCTIDPNIGIVPVPDHRLGVLAQLNKPLRVIPATISDLFLLTEKPVLYVCYVDEDSLTDDGQSNDQVQKVRELATTQNAEVVVVCAKIEAEIAELDDDEKNAFLEELGLTSAGLDRLIRAANRELSLINYFTAGEKEVRAWKITKGTKAPQAAGVIHSDFEKGFIRAETIKYNDYVACGSENSAKDAGKMRSEGREYVVADGDVLHFRFNV